MISLERSIPVNPPGTSSPVTRAEVWHGLVLKADNALPFVPSMTYCQVLERETDSQFTREIEFKGDRLKERVKLETERGVTFERIAGPVLGTIHNTIDENKNGELFLRFAFQLTLEGVADGSPAEKEYLSKMESAYLGAVDATLNAIRKLHDENAKSPTKSQQPPDWVRTFYSDIDGMRLEPFVNGFTDDGKVIFGNNPPAVGRAQIGAAIGGLWSAINGLKHRFKNVWVSGTTTILEADITYSRKDGKDVVVPCVSILERPADKVTQLRITLDLAPVFAP